MYQMIVLLIQWYYTAKSWRLNHPYWQDVTYLITTMNHGFWAVHRISDMMDRHDTILHTIIAVSGWRSGTTQSAAQNPWYRYQQEYYILLVSETGLYQLWWPVRPDTIRMKTLGDCYKDRVYLDQAWLEDSNLWQKQRFNPFTLSQPYP